MLEKYRKLAHDAHLNGDRVQEEYYLQFADHYFRVLADQKQRQDDARQRRDERSPDSPDSGRSEEQRYRDYDDYGDDADDNSAPASSANDREQPSHRDQHSHRDQPAQSDDEAARSDNEAVYEPAQNPFVRDNSAVRNAAKPRKPRRPVRDAGPEGEDGNTPELNLGVDPSVLPPSIGAERAADEPEAEAKPRRRTRKPKAAEDKSADDSGEKLEPVG